MTVQLFCDDCAVVLAALETNSVDAIVTDPPAGISFMGREWDHDKGGRDAWIAWMTGIARGCLRVLKPGGHALVWALPRTSHWTATAWENAGFEVRDRVAHVFGSGFPKSLDVAKAIDRAAGAEREIVGAKVSADGRCRTMEPSGQQPRTPLRDGGIRAREEWDTAPATPAAATWDGWGTALKPAMEDWWLLRKPLTGTVAENVLEWGCGALNIDDCRVGGANGTGHWSGDDGSDATSRPGYEGGFTEGGQQVGKGRWPSHLILSHHPECRLNGTRKVKASARASGPTAGAWGTTGIYGAANGGGRTDSPCYADADGMEEMESWDCHPDCPIRLLDEQGGISKSSGGGGHREHGAAPNGIYGDYGAVEYPSNVGKGDTGGPSRFFYQPKASRRDRDEGLDDMPHHTAGECTDRKEGSAGLNSPRAGAGRTSGSRNFHPTVKATPLMRYLCRLITPPGGTILDPFMGSGSTGKAAVLENFSFIGADYDPDSYALAEKRIAWAQGQVQQLRLEGV